MLSRLQRRRTEVLEQQLAQAGASITDGLAMMCSLLTLSNGDNRGIGDVDRGKTYDVYFHPSHLQLFDGPACNILD
eukprot:9076444-Lingulodinium_polyedra.AAC.1